MLNNDDALSLMYQALSDSTRRAILEHLTSGPRSVSDLAKPLPMSLPAVVQHLGVLEQAGLVKTRKTGRVRTCQLDPDALSQAEQWINERRALWNSRLDKLGEFLAGTEGEDQ